MKRVFSSSSLWQAQEIVALLEARHVPVMLANEQMATTPGVVPGNERLSVDAEVWVLDDRDEALARRLIADHVRAGSAGAGSHWTCGHCGEENPGTFEWCWACGGAPPAAG